MERMWERERERGRKGMERVSEDTGGQLQDGVAACGR